MKKIILDRWRDEAEVPDKDWHNAISSLVMLGYSVYADTDKIVFELGNDDVIEEKTDCDKCYGLGYLNEEG